MYNSKIDLSNNVLLEYLFNCETNKTSKLFHERSASRWSKFSTPYTWLVRNSIRRRPAFNATPYGSKQARERLFHSVLTSRGGTIFIPSVYRTSGSRELITHFKSSFIAQNVKVMCLERLRGNDYKFRRKVPLSSRELYTTILIVSEGEKRKGKKEKT